MKKKDNLKEKAECYATDKVYTCHSKECIFYWTCRAYKRSLEIGHEESRENILEYECY